MRRTCKHCGADVGSAEFATCGHCAGLQPGRHVQTPYGPGDVLFAKHSGGFVCDVPGVGKRPFEGSRLAILDKPPAPPAIPTREPGCDDQPVPAPTPDQDTAAALDCLEHEESIRLERTWRAGRLEILLRARSGAFGP